MHKTEARVVPLDATVRRQILELAKSHDEKLKSLQQDMYRAETKLRVEQRWRWADRAICLAVGFGAAAFAWQTGFSVQMLAALETGLADLMTYLGSSVSIGGFPVPLNALVFIGAALALSLVLGAIMSLRPSPKRAARELLRRVDKDPAVSGVVFANGTFPKSSYEMAMEEEGKTNELDLPPPTLELLMHNILHPAANRRLQ